MVNSVVDFVHDLVPSDHLHTGGPVVLGVDNVFLENAFNVERGLVSMDLHVLHVAKGLGPRLGVQSSLRPSFVSRSVPSFRLLPRVQLLRGGKLQDAILDVKHASLLSS